MLKKKYKKDIAKHNSCDGRIFRNAKVKALLKKVESVFKDRFVLLVSEFRNHSEPIVSINKMIEQTSEAEQVFGIT